MVEVKIDCIRMSLMTQNRVVILKEESSERYLAIWIGPYEAEAITTELQDVQHKRPLTHDLLKSLIVEMGAEVQYVVVTELRRPDDIFFAKIVIELEGRELEVDSRPSDAIALAVRARVPIYVEAEVMDAAAVTPEEDVEHEVDVTASKGAILDDKLGLFKDFVETLDLDNLDEE
ncbi:MAG: bifunctional nuclease family protein [Chloroflexi bacterium]|nr:bifunctional nuclease family protein [Chloroflexota bacterium]